MSQKKPPPWRIRENACQGGSPDVTASRAQALGLDPAAFLANNDSTAFVRPQGNPLVPGSTLTNINDFRAILVDTA